MLSLLRVGIYKNGTATLGDTLTLYHVANHGLQIPPDITLLIIYVTDLKHVDPKTCKQMSLCFLRVIGKNWK